MERNAILVILVIVFICLLTNFIFQQRSDSTEKGMVIIQDTLALLPKPSKHTPYSNKETNYTPYSNNKSQAHHKNPSVIDLNTATKEVLADLPGIGKVLSERIIKYRDVLGGFCKKEQLKEVYGITGEVFELMKIQISVNEQKVRKLNPNTATLLELDKHPYISEKLARQIINYREKVKKYQQVNDLSQLYEMDESTLEKLSPYIEIE